MTVLVVYAKDRVYMSKTLLIFRHAKTEPFSEGGQDFGRKLTAGGFADAGKMGERVAGSNLIPQSIYCSTAARTRQTLEAAWPNWPIVSPKVLYLDELYLASAGDLLSFVNELEDEADKIMLIGHNPGLHHLVQLLTDTVLPKFSPATLAVLESNVKIWADISPASMNLKAVLQP